MDQFITSLRLAIEAKNWQAALIISLALPDICGKYHTNTSGSEARYTAWFNEFLLKKYTAYVGPTHEEHVFLSASNCYALRCALLHEGSDTITAQRARQVLDNFYFVLPPSSGLVHMNEINSTLQLQIDIFSKDILAACEEWWDNLDDVQRREINNKLLVVHEEINF